MSDVSKTNELIAWADREYERINEIPWSARKCIERLANELEAATRVPVQGESNDDREVLEHIRTTRARQRFLPNVDREARERVSRFCQEWRKLRSNDHESIYNLHLGTEREVELRTADLERLSRATVPDAATECAEKCQARDEAIRLNGIESFSMGETDRADVAEAERDAALAAAERVRAVLFKRYTGSPGYENTPEHVKEIDAIRDLYGEDLADDLLAALDGAPEPEVKP